MVGEKWGEFISRHIVASLVSPHLEQRQCRPPVRARGRRHGNQAANQRVLRRESPREIPLENLSANPLVCQLGSPMYVLRMLESSEYQTGMLHECR
mgnify:CR=1 FL=1